MLEESEGVEEEGVEGTANMMEGEGNMGGVVELSRLGVEVEVSEELS